MKTLKRREVVIKISTIGIRDIINHQASLSNDSVDLLTNLIQIKKQLETAISLLNEFCVEEDFVIDND